LRNLLLDVPEKCNIRQGTIQGRELLPSVAVADGLTSFRFFIRGHIQNARQHLGFPKLFQGCDSI
jgi:hypothetical protein